MRAAALAALMAVAVSVSITTNALESSCAIPAETLSFECSSDCEANEACMLTSNSSVHTNATETVSFSSLTSCPLACFAATSGFNATPSGTTRTFTLLVPFGTWKSDMELLNQPATASEHTGELLGNETLNATFASISNDFLKKIDPLKLPFNTTSVSIRGGSKILEPSTKSRVANVELAENFLLKNDTNVTELTLVNLNLNTSINKLANTFPAILTKLVLSNNLLTEFPAPVTKLKKLTSLFLDNNFITNVPSSARMKGLLSLVLNHNNITKYNGVFETASYLDLSYNQLTKAPYTIARHTQLQTLNLTDTKLKTYSAHLLSLERLYITGNNLTTIPTVMFRHTRLKELYLDNNKFMKNVALSTKQARFIFNLKNFTIDEAALKTNCSTESQLKLHNYTFCLTDGPVTPQATQQNTPMPTPKAKPAKPTPKPKGATKLKELKKRMVSVRVGIKSSPSTTSTGVPPPVDTVETSVVSTTDAAPVLARVESTTLASQRSNSNGDSGENDPVALAVTGVSGGVAVALAVMGSIWIGGKAAKRLKQTTTSTRGAKKPIQQQPQQLVIEDEDEAGEVDAGVAV